MKRMLTYPELWRKKRTELPVKGNPDADWLHMSSMLNERMPVVTAAKKPSRFNMPKWGLPIFVGISSVIAVYVFTQLYLSKKHHHAVKPDTQQIHRDTPAPAKDTLPTPDTGKTPTAVSTPGNSPVIAGANPLLPSQTKLKNDTNTKGKQKIVDSIKAPGDLITPARRDSLATQVETAPQKPVRDSIGPVDLTKRNVQKDTLNIKKTPKKKKRSKFSIFF